MCVWITKFSFLPLKRPQCFNRWSPVFRFFTRCEHELNVFLILCHVLLRTYMNSVQYIVLPPFKENYFSPIYIFLFIMSLYEIVHSIKLRHEYMTSVMRRRTHPSRVNISTLWNYMRYTAMMLWNF